VPSAPGGQALYSTVLQRSAFSPPAALAFGLGFIPLAVERLKKALVQARKHTLLGNNILGTKFSFDISLVLGAGDWD